MNSATPPMPPFRVFDRPTGGGPVAGLPRDSALAIGNFDGVHRGHQSLLAAVKADASRRGAPAGVIIFEPHPREFFQPNVPQFRLTTRTQKLRLFALLGLDLAVVLPFDADLAALSPDVFITDILVAALAVGHVVIGYDFNFGKARAGSAETMQAAGRRLGFGVTVVPPVKDGQTAFSSSAIRAKLAAGDVAAAARALGHRWRIDGPVVGGAQRGTGLGFPTANIHVPIGCGLAHGIYATRVHVGGGTHFGAAYWGARPQFDNGQPVLEVFLLDFDGDLYGQDLSVEFVEFIRADGKFTGVEALQRQMQVDCDTARRILNALPHQSAAAHPIA